MLEMFSNMVVAEMHFNLIILSMYRNKVLLSLMAFQLIISDILGRNPIHLKTTVILLADF